MCQSKAQGGRRCPPNPTSRALRQLRSKQSEPGVQSIISSLITARSKYGSIVTPLTLSCPPKVTNLLDALSKVGDPLLVGGTVRDAMIGVEPKDFDIEVHGTDLDILTLSLRSQGYHVDEVGRQFGVLKTRVGNEDMDVSVPRHDSLSGAGHRGVEVDMDSEMGVRDAAARRDFTINAMMYDHKYKVCIDPWGGRDDFQNKILRHVSEAFSEDPLRPLRAFQFAGRYSLTLSPETAALCRELRNRADELPVERIRGEWGKFYDKSVSPAHSLAALREMGWDTTVPGLDTLPDGVDLDQVAKKGPVILAAVMSRNMSDSDAREFAHRTIEGDDIARSAYVLSRTSPPEILDRPNLRKWARDLGKKSLTIEDWALRERVWGNVPDNALNAARRLHVASERPLDLLAGRHIILLTSRLPGPWIGQLLSEARDAQDNGTFTTMPEAVVWLSVRPELNG